MFESNTISEQMTRQFNTEK